MDHSEALRLQAAEKYILGELPADLRDQYEEHFFDCAQCAADIRVATHFVSTARSALRSMPKETEAPRESFLDVFARFFRPVWTVPALALLLIALSYQTFVAIPNLKQTPSSPAVGSANFVSLIGVNSRGDSAKSFPVAAGKPLIIDVDIPATAEFTAGYECLLRDPSGRVILDSAVSLSEARDTVHLIAPAAQLQPGAYTLSVLGRPSSSNAPTAEVLNTKFTLQVTR